MNIENLRGENGGIFVDGTDEVTGIYYAMVVINETVVAAITMPNISNAAALVGLTLAAGTVIYGKITNLTLTSGVVELLKY